MALAISTRFVEARISQHLPFLMRFARSLVGSSSGGNALVAELMADLAADEVRVLGELNPRIALYREFVDLYRRNRHKTTASVAGANRSGQIDWTIQAHCETSRIAMLLSAVEGFSKYEVCEVLGFSESALELVLREVRQRLGVKTGQRICIIEDVPLIAMQIRNLLTEMGYEVCSISRTESQAVADIMKHAPDLIVSDVKLSNNGSGPNAVMGCLSKRSIPVVFVTAFPETLLTGKSVEPAFIISKPFYPPMLQAIVNQALYFNSQAFRITGD